MAVVTIDSTDTEAVIANAQGDAPKAKPAEKPEPKVEDDTEDDDGLTAEQKAELSAKMLKAIGKKHRLMKDAEEFAASQYNERRLAEERAANLERQLAELKAKETPKAQEKSKPDRKDFPDDVAYVEALTDYKAEQQFAKFKAEQAAEAAERRQQEMIATASERIAKARELVPDFDDLVGGADIQVPGVVMGYMQRSEMLAELSYHFAQNPDELVALSKLQPDEQLVRVGKIEAKLAPFAKRTNGATPSTDDEVKTKSSDDTGTLPSKARTAPVITPLSSSGAAQVNKLETEMNPRELIQAWAKAHKVDFSRRKRH